MQHFDLYRRFLAGCKKIKVFPTKEKARPFYMDKKLLKGALPFLIASAVCFITSEKVREKNDNLGPKDYKRLYENVINTYHLDTLKEKESLPLKDVQKILKNPNALELNDFNYNHMPENKENFWNIVRNGVKISIEDMQESPNLTDKQKLEYKILAFKMLSQISRYKGTKDDVDLTDYNNLKAFLYFENVIEHRDDFEEVIVSHKGWIDEKKEVLGRYYKDYFNFYEKVKEKPILEKFAEALYKSDAKDMILSYDDSLYCNEKSYKILDKWLKGQDIKDKDLYKLTSVDEDLYCNAIALYYRRGSKFDISLYVDSKGDMGEGYYAPVGDVIIHELMHVMQRRPSSAETPSDNHKTKNELKGDVFNEYRSYADEIGPTLMSIAIEDYLYKDMRKIDQNCIVDYGCVDFDGKQINVGELAMWFRNKVKSYEKNNTMLNVDKMLSEPGNFNELLMIADGHFPYDNTNYLNVGNSR